MYEQIFNDLYIIKSLRTWQGKRKETLKENKMSDSSFVPSCRKTKLGHKRTTFYHRFCMNGNKFFCYGFVAFFKDGMPFFTFQESCRNDSMRNDSMRNVKRYEGIVTKTQDGGLYVYINNEGRV